MALEGDLDRDGYALARGVLAPAEVARLRLEVSTALRTAGVPFGLGMAVPNASVAAPASGWIYTHPGIVAAVRESLGETDITFTMEAGLHRNITGPWHKDTGEGVLEGGYFGTDPIGRDDCRVVKVGVYLQDHHDGTGLRVRPGSHRQRDLAAGEEVPLDLAAGDAVLFDVRITHCGERPGRSDRAIASAARLLPRRTRGAAVDRARRMAFRARRRPERLAAFFAYGPTGPMTATYARRNLDRQLAQLATHEQPVPAGIAAALRAEGITPLLA